MNIRDYCSQFLVYVYSSNVDLGTHARGSLANAGYEAFAFPDLEMLEQRIQDTPPHILILSTEGLTGSLSDVLKHLLEINFEIKFIILAGADQFESLAQSSLGIVDVIQQDLPSFEARILWAADRACEKIYLTYQNEQLFDELQEAKARVEEVHTAAVISMKQIEAPPSAPPPESPPPPPEPKKSAPSISLSIRKVEYQTSESKEDLIQKFLSHLGDTFCLYFKFLPSIKSFVASGANGIPVKDIQGVGVQLDASDLRELPAQLALGKLPEKFGSMLNEAFNLSQPKALPIYSSQALDGLIVCSSEMSADSLNLLNEEFAIFALCFANFVLERKVSALEVQDFVTELYNRTYYLKSLADEVTRARRQRQPVSVVKICLDDFSDIGTALGEIVRDELLKSVAHLILKSSRATDINCRTGLNELSLILPHCNKKGAALRAERIRRMIEAGSLLDNGMRLTVSLGVSEYPTLCDSAKSLDDSALKALKFISEKGGNKICLFKASESHKPEYQVSQDE